MKKFVLATIALLALGAEFAQADGYISAPAGRTCAATRWQGSYIGINGGAVNWTANRTDQDEVLVDTATYVQKSWGGVVGGQIGYNWPRYSALSSTATGRTQRPARS